MQGMRYLELYANIWAHISIKVTRVHIKSRSMRHGIAMVKSIHRHRGERVRMPTLSKKKYYEISMLAAKEVLMKTFA